MTIYELADTMGRALVIKLRYCVHQDVERWYCYFEGAEVKEGAALLGGFGDGSTPREAVMSYIDDIKGQTLVFDARADNRCEHTIPKSLTAKEIS